MARREGQKLCKMVCLSSTTLLIIITYKCILHISAAQIELREIDVIPNNPCIIVYSSRGYIKRMSPNTFSVQGLRGTGVAGTRLKDNESLEDLIFANDHDNLLFFTREGHAHSLPAYSIPQASRTASGTPITQVRPELSHSLED
jgi:DNA gyrase subunit A